VVAFIIVGRLNQALTAERDVCSRLTGEQRIMAFWLIPPLLFPVLVAALFVGYAIRHGYF
jgi:hypothetical protein